MSFPLIRYAKGVTVVSSRKPTKYTGFHIGLEQSAELDDLLSSLGVPAVRVKHKSGNEENYWQLDTLKGYILCTAVPVGHGPEVWRKTGVPYVWNEHANTYNYGSQLQCMLFLMGLLEAGYTAPLVLHLSRTVTEHFLTKVLGRQAAMVELVKKALKRQGKPHDLAIYAYWLELVKSSEEYTTKNGGSYYPPVTTIPAPLTGGYLRSHEAPPEHIAAVEAFLPILPQWAEAASARLQEPPRDTGTAAEPEEPPEHD